MRRTRKWHVVYGYYNDGNKYLKKAHIVKAFDEEEAEQAIRIGMYTSCLEKYFTVESIEELDDNALYDFYVWEN